MQFSRPPRVHGGNRQQIKADHFNALSKCIEELQAQLSALSPASPRRRGGITSPFSFKVSVRRDGETYLATVAPGYVRVKNPSAVVDPVIEDWMPEIGATPLDELADGLPPSVTVAHGDVIYCHFATTVKGIIEEAPTIEAATAGQATTHYQPDPDGVEGDYWLPIAHVAIVDGVVTVTQHQHGGPIELVPNLWNYEQVGGGRKIIKERDADVDEWKIRTLKEAASSPQVKINENTDYIEIRGNSYNNSITSARKVTATVVDGLVTNLEYDDEEDGFTGTLAIVDCDLSTPIVSLTISEGRITHIDAATSGTVTKYVQSCHWIDDPPEDDWRAE